MSIEERNPQALIDTLRRDLLKARKARDSITTEALQSVIAAIDNAGAVPTQDNLNSIGVGSTEMARKKLSVRDIRGLIQDEIAELQQAIEIIGATDDKASQQLLDKAAVLQNYAVTHQPQ